VYRVYVDRMAAARNREQHKAVVDEMCRMFAFSKAKAYKVLEENGWDSGRAKRKDAGSSSVDRELLTAVSAMTKQASAKTVKRLCR
jgi:hypothetical protein